MEPEMTAVTMEDSKPEDSIADWGAFASTTEALTATLLVEVVRRASLNSVPGPVSVILEGVYAAELDHWNFTKRSFAPARSGSGFRTGSRRPGDSLDLTALGKGVRGGRAPLRQYVSPRRHDLCRRRGIDPRALRRRARGGRGRAPCAWTISRRREPTQQSRFRGVRAFDRA
jgi:hypothetical protein